VEQYPALAGVRYTPPQRLPLAARKYSFHPKTTPLTPCSAHAAQSTIEKTPSSRNLTTSGETNYRA
jgi:hypothetical protein